MSAEAARAALLIVCLGLWGGIALTLALVLAAEALIAASRLAIRVINHLGPRRGG